MLDYHAMGRLSIEVSVPKERGDVCVAVVGATDQTALDVMADYARSYLTDENGPQYSRATFAIFAACAKCGGNGRHLKPRTKRTYIDCAACNREGFLSTGDVATVFSPRGLIPTL